jgi:AcrR family transcriptional regulator
MTEAGRATARTSDPTLPAPSPLLGDQTLTTRGRRTRSSLLAAARDVFERVGFQDARIADISAAAGTSYGTFYRYFESKHEIMRELFTLVTGDMFTASIVGDRVGNDPWARIDAANRQYLHVHARNARLISIIDEMAPRDSFFRDLKLSIREIFLRRNEDGIRRLQERGQARTDIDPRIAASILGGMVEHHATMWFVYGQSFDEESGITTLTELWSSAIGVSRVRTGEAAPQPGLPGHSDATNPA